MSMARVGPGLAQPRRYGPRVVDPVAQDDTAGVAHDGGGVLIGRSQLVLHSHLRDGILGIRAPDWEKATVIDQDEPR